MNIYEISIKKTFRTWTTAKAVQSETKTFFMLIAAKTGKEAIEKAKKAFFKREIKDLVFSKPNCIISNK